MMFNKGNTFYCHSVGDIFSDTLHNLQELSDGFIDYLWKYVQNPNVQGVYRQAAVSYIGSLLARGKFICTG